MNFSSASSAKFLHLFFLLISAFLPGSAIAVSEQVEKPVNLPCSESPSSGYCGIYCLYMTMKLFDVGIEYAELIKPEYIGSNKGSSLAELQKAARDKGLYAVPVEKLTSKELRRLPCPVILHVKSAADKKDYDHYELFLKTHNGQASLCDPPRPVRLVPFYELAPRWDGTGLMVSKNPIDLGVVFASARKRLLILSAITVIAILIVRWVRRRWFSSTAIISRPQQFGLSVAQGAGLTLLALLSGMVYHFVNDEGFLAHPNATASIEQAHLGNFIPKINRKQARKLLNDNAVFVDARSNDDFKAGHLEGAINVPVDISDDDRRKVMAGIAKNARIVIYCQSRGCKFAEMVAIKIMSDGFDNVSLLNGGWREWAGEKDL
jgi:rhodanese-related sulfurtransferase